MRRFDTLVLATLLLSCQRDPPPPPPAPITAEQQAELAKVVDEAWANAQKADDEARAAATAAQTAGAKTGGDGPCPVRYSKLEALEVDPTQLGSGAKVEAMKETLVILPSGPFGDGPAASAIRTPKDLWKMRLEKQVTAPRGYDALLASARAELAGKPAGTLVLVATDLVEPQGVGKESFSAGRLRGTLYAYAPSEKRVVCAAPVNATNSDLARSYTKGDPKAALLMDLVGRAVLGSFRQLAPLAPPR